MAQLTVTIFFGGFAVGQLLWGSLSDRFGRKPGILIGTVLYVIATVGCALAPDIETLLTLRAIAGDRRRRRRGARPGHHPRPVPRARRWRASCPWSWRRSSLAPIVAPSIGAVILTFASWRWIFGFLAIYGAVVLVLAAVFLEESLKVKDPQRSAIRRGSCARSRPSSVTRAAARGPPWSPWRSARSPSTSPTPRPC